MTNFTMIISMGLLLWVSTCQGAEYCLEQCANFSSDDCKGVNVGIPLHWTLNDTVVSVGYPNVFLSPLRHDGVGIWIQNITVHNVCDPVEIRCLELQRELRFYNVTFCEGNSTDSSTVNSASEPHPHANQSYIAAYVLPVFVVAVAVIIVFLISVWCLRRRRNHPPPSPPPPPPTTTGDGSANNDIPETNDGSQSESELTETVPPKETSGGRLTRRSAIPFQEPPKSDVSRDEVKIELEVVDDSACKPTIKIQFYPADLCLNNTDVHNKGSAGEQCSDEHGLTPAWLYGSKIKVTDIPSHGNVAYCMPPQSIPGQEGISPA